MKIVSAITLLVLTVYTFGFAITLWKEKQKFAAMAVIFICLALIILPYFSIYKQN